MVLTGSLKKKKGRKTKQKKKLAFRKGLIERPKAQCSYLDILREEQDTTSRFSGEVPNISLYLIAESLINKTISRILMHVF